jgi:hypothetical protein
MGSASANFVGETLGNPNEKPFFLHLLGLLALELCHSTPYIPSA